MKATVFAAAFATACLIFFGTAGPVHALADLEVVELDVPEWARPGERVDVVVEVLNRGDLVHGTENAGAAGYMVDIVLSSDLSTPIRFARFSEEFNEDVLLRNGRISNTSDLAEGQRQRFDGYRVQIPEDTPLGDYWICAVVDPGNRFGETVETDNVTCRPIQILAGPPTVDFAVEIVETRTVCHFGQELLHIWFDLSNLGTLESPRVRGLFGWVNLLVDGEWNFGPVVGEVVRASPRPLGAGQVIRINLAVPTDFAGRLVETTIHADMRREVDEPNEDNNRESIQVQVPDAPCKQ